MRASSPPILEPAPAPLALDEDLRRSAGELVRLVPLFGVVGLAGLYLIGALVKVGQLQAARVEVADALPLIPLQQLLAASLRVVVVSVILLPITVLALNFGWRAIDGIAVRWDDNRRRLMKLAARSRSMAARLERIDEPGGRREDSAGLGQEMKVLQADLAQVGRAQLLAIRVLRRRIVFVVLVSVGMAALAAFWLMTDPMWIAAGGLALSVAHALRHRPIVAGAAAYGVFVCGVLLSAYTEPSPLPVAAIRTTDHRLERGRLIAATDAQWHLAVAPRVIRSIPVDRIVASSMRSPAGGGGKPTWKLLRDLMW